MKNNFIFIFIVLLNLNALSQFNCNDILYNEDTLVIINDELYSGYCENFNKNSKVISKSYIGYGILDSIVYFDKNGLIEAVEPYKKWKIHGTFKCYYKNGNLKQSIEYKNDNPFGFCREYYSNGKIKSEAYFIENYRTKGDSSYTWTRKGVKYLRIEDKEHVKNIGKLQMVYAGRGKKIRVKDNP